MEPRRCSRSAPVSSSGSFTLTGPGTLKLTGANTISGSGVSSGTLQVDGSLGTVTVGSTGTNGVLTGTGMVGNLNVVSGGTVAPGDAGVGKLSVNGTAFLAGGSFLSINVTDTSNFGTLSASGKITAAGNLQVSSPAAFSFLPTTRLTIIDNQSGMPISGTFASAPEGTTEPLNGQPFTLTYAGGTNGQSVQLKAPNLAPSITAGPTATPNPTVAGSTVQFNVAATDPNNDTLTYTWNFGDSTTGTGATPTHSYATAGLYTASVTVSDGSLSVSASVQVTINSSDLSVRAFAGTQPNAIEGAGPGVRFDQPKGSVVDAQGNIYLCEAVNHIVRKLTPAGVSSTVAGRAGVAGTTDGTGDVARFNTPQGIGDGCRRHSLRRGYRQPLHSPHHARWHRGHVCRAVGNKRVCQ